MSRRKRSCLPIAIWPSEDGARAPDRLKGSHEHGARHDRPDPRLLGDPAQLGGLDGALRGEGLPRPHARYPGFEVEVEALNADPAPIEALTAPKIIEHLERGGRARCRQPPILIGHSAGGAFTQLLLDRGYGAAGVVLNSAPTEGVPVVPLSQLKSTFPVLQEPGEPAPGGRLRLRAVELRVHQHLPGGPRRAALYERYAIPVSGEHPLRERAGQPDARPAGHRVDYHNDDRAPLLFVAGTEDHIMPPKRAAVQRRALQAATRSPRSSSSAASRTCCPPRPAGRRSPTTSWPGRCEHARRDTEVRLTHVGGPTTLIEVGGWRLLTDPTFDPPGRRYGFGWGTSSRKLAGPAVAVDDARPDRRRAAHPRPPRRQPRRRRARAAARRGRPSSPRRPAPAGSAAGARGLRPWATTGLEAARTADHRGHRDAVPARPAAEPADRRRRHRLRAGLGRASGTACSGSPATPSCYGGVRQVAGRVQVGTAVLHLGGVRFPITGPGALLDDRAPRRSSCAGWCRPAHRGPGALRGLEPLRRAAGRSRRRSRPPRTTSATGALAAARDRDGDRPVRFPLAQGRRRDGR